MATIGQIYYNVIDARYAPSSDNYKITTSGYGSDLVEGGEPGQRSGKIYKDIVEGKVWSKVGIQAPPGTQMVFNETKTILMGRTGIYELDEDININQLKFIQPKTYEKDEEASEEKMASGLAMIVEAQKEIDENIETKDGKTEINDIDALNAAKQKLEEALALYSSGVRGIYKLAGYSDLENVIIDYIEN